MNEYRPFLKIYPEDEALRNVIIGILNTDTRFVHAQIKVESCIRGLGHLSDRLAEFNRMLHGNPNLHILLVIDFDDDPHRVRIYGEQIDGDVRDRFFVTGSMSEIEALKGSVGFKGKNETFGMFLAEKYFSYNWPDCVKDIAWLADSRAQLLALDKTMRPFLWRQ